MSPHQIARSFLVVIFSLATALLATPPAAAAPSGPDAWPFLSRSTIEADTFTQSNPEWDGRGVLIAVLDTGVALGLPGLSTTTDGRPKILDVQVFTDEDRIELATAETGTDANGTALYASDGRWLYGFEQISAASAGENELLVGYFLESAFRNGAVEDLNANGRDDETFGVVVFRPTADGPWAAVLDTNANGRLDDEMVVHDYSLNQEWFYLGGNDPRAEADPVAFALNLWPEERAAALYFDGGAHGTHVAGIASGYGINGQEGYNGIAPGAQILAAKIGNNTLSGGATGPGSMIRAWRWAVERAAELEMPLVIQMSYGIGSEREGTADAERLINALLADNPEVAATLSAGNDGPGLSSVGLPAAASEPFSVAAMLAADTAHAVYGVTLPDDRLFYFSSRGGELAKPDFACPGFAASSVPDHTGGRDVMRGTSMAAPQAAGACALLYSAAKHNGLPVRRDLLRAALTRSARPLAPYGPLDVGAGVVDVPAAWGVYEELAEQPHSEPLLYEVSTASPESVTDSGTTVFYRGAFYPRGQHRHEVAIDAVFPPHVTAQEINRFYRALDLECSADWVHLDRPSTYLKQDGPATFRLVFEPRQLTEPGLYQTEVTVWNKRYDRSQRERLGPELRIPVAVAVPIQLEGDGTLQADIEDLLPSVVHRTFVTVEPWTGSLDVAVELAEKSRDLSALVAAFDPEGRELFLGRVGERRPLLKEAIPQHRLTPGVWEITVTGAIDNRRPVDAAVRLSALPLVAAAPRSCPVQHDVGKAPKATVSLTSSLDAIWRGQATGRVVGTVHRTDETIQGHQFSKPLSLAPEESTIELHLQLDPADWGLFTDIAVQVLDPEGHAVAQSGFTYSVLSLRLPAGSAGPFSLKLLGGTADPAVDSPTWHVQIEERHLYREPVTMQITSHDDPDLTLYPYRAAELELAMTATPPAPAGSGAWLATVHLAPTAPDQPKLELELELVDGDSDGDS